MPDTHRHCDRMTVHRAKVYIAADQFGLSPSPDQKDT